MKNEGATGTIIENIKTRVKEQNCIVFDITTEDKDAIDGVINKIKDLIDGSITDITEDCWWVLHNQTKVTAGKGKNSLPSDDIHPHILKELRLFSAQGELHLWKCKEGFCYRLRLDEENENKKDIPKDKDENKDKDELFIYMEKHYRTKVKGSEEKDRSTSGFDFLGCDGKLFDRFKVYNYFKYDCLGCIQFTDARLVKFMKKGEN